MKLNAKVLAPLFVVCMLGMATSAFAGLNCTVTATPIPREVLNSHWANVADLNFSCLGTAGATTEASITIFYAGLTITNAPTVPTVANGGHNIAVVPGALVAALDKSRADLGATGVNNAGSLVGLTIPAQATPAVLCAAACTFSLTNVVLSMAGGTTSGQSVSASINVVSQGGNVTLTGSPTVVVSSVVPALNTAFQLATGTNPASFTAAGANPPSSANCSTQACLDARARFSVVVTEDHIDSWRMNTQYYNNASGTALNGTNLLFTFSGMVPGSIISNCVLTPTPAGPVWDLTGSGIAGTAGTTTLVAEIRNGTANLDQTAIDSLRMDCGSSTTSPGYSAGGSTAPATTPVTVNVQPYPNGAALPLVLGVPSASAGGLTAGTPRFQAGSSVGPVTVVNFVGGVTGQTTMLIPWVIASGAAAPPAGTFNTGVVIANTTKDPAPFGTDAQGAATDTAGNLSFYFFPADGSASFTVTPSTGFGLANGVLASGSSFIGNFSDILKAGSVTGNFSGYVFVVANFTHAHGSAFVYGGSAAERITSAQDVLVLGNPSTFSRNTNFGALPSAEITTR